VALLTGPQERPLGALQLGDVFSTPARANESMVVGAIGYRRVKRALDVLVSFGALLIIAPLLLIIALAIVIDSRGPVLYRQTRIGHRGR
jgi:lipopolysaccharide/colanic/teichoic acid biosynthesis glycosyltransferase